MSIKIRLFQLPIFLLLLLATGCVTEETVIRLNPDGSGTVEYTTHFDRAPDEMREQIRERMELPGMKLTTSREGILENYPEPHFQLLEFEADPETMHTRIRLKFRDINALLIPRSEANLGLESLDFTVQGDQLLFSVKEETVSQTWPEQFDEHPGREGITVINAQSGESAVFEREMTSETEPADWSGLIAFPSHTIVRNRDIQVFHDYPVIKPPVCKVDEAKWTLRDHRMWSSFELDLITELPDDGKTYIRWDKPVVVSGGFLPDGTLQSISTGSTGGRGDFKPTVSQKIELKFSVPTNRVDKLSASTTRIQAHRCSGSSIIEVGKLKPNTEYSLGNSTLKTKGMENNRVSFTLKGEADRLKNAFVDSARGNRFMLKRASWSSSGSDSTTVTYWELLPIEGCTLLLELHNHTEPCYIDLSIPAIDLTQRAWRVDDSAAKVASSGWKKELASVHPELFEIEVPPVDAELFENKELYKAYFQGLEDQQLLPAIVQVVDYMVQHNPNNGQDWIQTVAQREILERKEFLESSREEITDQLFALYLHLPEKMICLTTFFSNLGLRDSAQPMAIEQLSRDNMRFSNDSFFGRELTEKQVNVLKSAIPASGRWMEQKNLLEVLDRAKCADEVYASGILSDRSMHEFVRRAALRIILRDEANADGLAQRIAMDSTEAKQLRTTALTHLMNKDDFPTEALSACMADSEGRALAVRQLDQHLSAFLRLSKNGPAEKAALRAALEPIIPLLLDLSEQLKKYDAKPATEVLEKIEKLS